MVNGWRWKFDSWWCCMDESFSLPTIHCALSGFAWNFWVKNFAQESWWLITKFSSFPPKKWDNIIYAMNFIGIPSVSNGRIHGRAFGSRSGPLMGWHRFFFRGWPSSYWCVLYKRREFSEMIHWLTINVIIPATTQQPIHSLRKTHQ